MIVDSLGSSEGLGLGAAAQTKDNAGAPTKFMADGNTLIIGDDMKPVPSGTMGRIARGGLIPRGYWKDPVKTAATFPEIDGVRYSIPGDFAIIEWMLFTLNVLIVLVSLTRYQNGIAWKCCIQSPTNRRATIGVTVSWIRTPRQNITDNFIWLFGARIITCYYYKISSFVRYLAHYRPFRAITISSATKYNNYSALGTKPHRPQSSL
jgi:hypothetical protein